MPGTLGAGHAREIAETIARVETHRTRLAGMARSYKKRKDAIRRKAQPQSHRFADYKAFNLWRFIFCELPNPITVVAGIAGTQRPGMAIQTHPCGLDTGNPCRYDDLAEASC